MSFTHERWFKKGAPSCSSYMMPTLCLLKPEAKAGKTKVSLSKPSRALNQEVQKNNKGMNLKPEIERHQMLPVQFRVAWRLLSCARWFLLLVPKLVNCGRHSVLPRGWKSTPELTAESKYYNFTSLWLVNPLCPMKTTKSWWSDSVALAGAFYVNNSTLELEDFILLYLCH